MSSVATAVVGGAVIGGIMQGNAAQSAADTQANASNNATAAQQQMFNTITQNQQPFMQAGTTALNTLNGQLSSLNTPINNTNWQQYMSPGYQFQLDQGKQALMNSQAAGNGSLTGAAMKALIGYNQGMANTAYNDAFNQYQTQNQNIYNRLAGLAQLGQNAAANTGMAGAGMASGIANTITGAGNAAAAGQIGQANAYAGMANNIGGYTMMNQLMGSGSGSSAFNPAVGSTFGGSVASTPSTPLTFGFGA